MKRKADQETRRVEGTWLEEVYSKKRHEEDLSNKKTKGQRQVE